MNIHDLRPGDVLLFSEADDWISWWIARVTQSRFTHAGLTYRRPEELVEATPPSVMLSHAPERLKGRDVHVMRFTGTADLAPVVDVASGFLNKVEPYPVGNAIMMLLIGSVKWGFEITGDSPSKQLFIRYLEAATGVLMDLWNHAMFPDTHPLVCTQLVYEAFEGAGSAFHLDIDDPYLPEGSAGSPPGRGSLVDQVLASWNADAAASPGLSVGAPGAAADHAVQMDRLAEALAHEQGHEAARPLEPGLLTGFSDEAGLEDQMNIAFARFAQAAIKAGLIPAENRDVDLEEALHIFSGNRSRFISPENFYSNTRNLDFVGVVNV